MVEYFCCPAPNPHPPMEMNDSVIRCRQALKAIVYGDLGALICYVYLFGADGYLRLLWVWFDYFAYAMASQHAVMFMQMFAGLFLWIQLLYAMNPSLVEPVFPEKLSQALFVSLSIWEMVKIFAGCKIYREFKRASESYAGLYGVRVDDFSQATDIET